MTNTGKRRLKRILTDRVPQKSVNKRHDPRHCGPFKIVAIAPTI